MNSTLTQKPLWKEVLESEFNNRKEEKPDYSLRNFARDLELSQSLLLYILKDKRRLTADKAFFIAKKLNLPIEKKYAFVESTVS